MPFLKSEVLQVAIVTPQKLSDQNNKKIGEPRQGSRTVKGTTVHKPARGSHPTRSGGPQDPSRAMDHHTSRSKARGSQTTLIRLRHQTTEPFTGRGHDDKPWWLK
uniref:Uncharacterized protein n=1 Tax=Solanum tuberosum TaxID=4113 RepID=M1DSF2_SOLTU